ncbi:MAG: hypothetical protein JJ866_25050 [Roseibium sp.]|uniref:hypothetical protein n=1 Tax=Roseibium sp. TaxID=1936156 RepID=UPI001B2B1973|nr:hypothetical protein [Roseibium sp.]MBO6895227.1 hypothetical protein [Roseibium sp.]MBO6930737.1 hypothetical protein [Roseibium sp.]
MIARLFGFLSGWKAKLAALGVVVAAFGAVLLKAYLAGRAAARTAADKASLKAMRRRKEINDEVEAMGHADVDKRFAEYMRDDR